MSAHPPSERLRAYLAGHATADEVAHVEACPACTGALALLTGDDSAADDLRRAAQRPALPSAPDPFAGTPRRLGPFDLLYPLGRGGMGVVYLAWHREQGAWWAVKLSPAGHVHRARFLQERRLGALLRHPNLCLVGPAGTEAGYDYFAMEYVNGSSWHELVARRGPLPVAVACALVREAALGLDHAHALGIVHRDPKPANFMLAVTGAVKLLDMGLARDLGGGPAERPTAPNVLPGTPDYMAPEQWTEPAGVDARADLYALGCTLYELLEGHAPFEHRPSPLDKMNAHCRETPPPLARPDVPAGLRTLLFDELLARDRGRRPTAATLAERLRAWLGGVDLAAWYADAPHGLVVPVPLPVPTVATERPGPLEADLDVRFWDDDQRRMRSLREPGVLPVTTGRLVQLGVRLSLPAHVYLLWIAADGKVAPVYPWKPGSAWEPEHADEPRPGLLLPRPAEDAFGGWPLTGEPGVETVVLLARGEGLGRTERANLPAWLAKLPRPQPLPDPARPFWFDCRPEAGDTRGFDPRAQPIADPLFQLESRLRDSLAARFTLVRAVQFTKNGARP